MKEGFKRPLPAALRGGTTVAPTRISRETLVGEVAPDGATSVAHMFQSSMEGLGLSAWAVANRSRIDSALYRRGAVLLRGFATSTLAEFQAFSRIMSTEVIRYGERSSPRTELVDGVYTSTDHPADQRILMHTEQSYTLQWPMRLTFFSQVTAKAGGNTPLADTRKILQRIRPEVVERFRKLGVRYVRNYNTGLGLQWQTVFQTERRDEVERYCHANDISVAWRGGDRLRTWQTRAAIRHHPITGELVWFNHAMFFNVASLDEVGASMVASVGEEGLPTQTYYGDGTPIDVQDVLDIRAAYDAESVAFQWQDGDVLMIDNMLVAHGREAYAGPRKLVCAMTDPIDRVASVPATEVAA
jgi:alpha-ketoglutarate-dependent taurine dioxygenase